MDLVPRTGVVHDRSAKVKEFFDHTDRWLRNNFQTPVRCLIAQELLGGITHSRILDLGCGDGSVSLQFLPQSNHITLVDLSEHMLERARENTPKEYRSQVAYVNADLLDFISADRYDIVLCIGVLAHVASVEATVAKVAAFVSPGGRCILQVTDSHQISGRVLHAWNSAHRRLTGSTGYSLNRMTAPQVASAASKHDLKLVSIRRHVLLLPGMGRLPIEWLFRYELLVSRIPALSRYGASALLLFEKAA